LDNKENKASVKEYVLCNLILVLLDFAIIFAGISEISLFVLIPIVFTYMFVRFDLKRMILPIIIIVLVPSFISMQINVAPAAFTLPVAAMLGIAIKRKSSLLKTISFAAIGEMISVLLALLIFYMNSGDAMAYFNDMTEQAIADVGTIYGVTEQYQQMLGEMFNMFLPSIFICMMAALSYLVFYITVTLLKKRDNSYMGVYRPFSEIKADKTCALAVVICFIVSMFADGIIAGALVNIIVILVFFIFACGVSSIAFTIKRIKNRVGKALAYIVLVIATFTGSSVFVFIGLIDAFINIRKIGKNPSDV